MKTAHPLTVGFLGLVIALTFASAADSGIIERDAARFALIVTSSPDSSRLGEVLGTRYGFEVFDLADPTVEEIDAMMSRLFESVQPYDQLVVHIALPMIRQERRSSYVPASGKTEELWTLLELRKIIDWLNAMPTGGVLLTFPSCGEREEIDPDLKELEYGDRPGPVEILQVCDFEALKKKGRPESSFLKWRGDEVGRTMAAALQEAASQDPATQVELPAVRSIDLARRLTREIAGLRVELVTVPLYSEPVFRFAHIGTVDEYLARYERATGYDELLAVIKDYIVAARESEPADSGLIPLLRNIALSPTAAANASLEPGEALQLRSYAVDSLAGLSSASSRAALRDVGTGATDSSLIRRTAISALSKNAPTQDLETLRSALRDPDAAVREAAVRGVVRARDEDAAPQIAELLPREQDTTVSISMIQGLSSFRRDEDRGLFTSLLGSPHWGTRKEAVAALSRLSPDAETNRKILTILVADDVDSVRETAAYALGRTVTENQRDEIVAGLRRALEMPTSKSSSAEALRSAAASSLGRIGGDEAERALRAALADAENSERVRITAAGGLGHAKSVMAVPELARAARASSAGLRRAAITALGSVATPETTEIIVSALDDADEYVRKEAERWVSELGIQPSSGKIDTLIAALKNADYKVRESAIADLAKDARPETIDRVIETLGSADYLARLGAAAVLGAVKSEDVRIVEALADAASDGDSTVRSAAVTALGAHGTAALRFIGKAMKDSAVDVRLAAVTAFSRNGSEQAVEYLERMAKGDDSDRVRRAAAHALAASRPRRSQSKHGGYSM